MNVRNNSGYSRAISTAVVVVILVVLVLAGVVAFYYAFPAASTTTSTTPTTTTSSATYKDTIILGTTDKVQTTIDPADAYDYFGINMIDNLGAGLVDFAPGTTNTSPSNLVPALATKWSASADGLTYTFILRSGIKYDDGTPFNSTDVKSNVDRGLAIYDPNGAFNGLTIDQIIGSVTTPNATAVVFHLKAPFSGFLNMMTFGIFYPVNPTKVPKLTCHAPCNDASGIVNFTSGNPAASNPNGLGPYTLTEWTRTGNTEVEMTLKANTNYWNYPAYPKTHTIIIKFYSTATALAAAVRSGDVDIGYRQFQTTDISSMMSVSSLKVYPSTGAFIQYLVINQGAGAPYNDINVRQGIAAALNRTDLSDTVFAGTATPLYSQIPLGMGYHIDAFKTAYGAGPNYNLTKTLLAKSGYNANNKLVVTLWYETTGHYPQSPDQAQVIKKDLEASGVITVNLNGVDFSTLHSDIKANSVSMFIYGWYPDFIDPFDYTTPFLQSSASSWLHDGYNSSAMDALLASSLTATGSNLASVYTQIQNLQAHDVPMIPLYQGGANCCGAIAKTTVGGVYLDVTLIFRLYTLTETTS